MYVNVCVRTRVCVIYAQPGRCVSADYISLKLGNRNLEFDWTSNLDDSFTKLRGMMLRRTKGKSKGVREARKIESSIWASRFLTFPPLFFLLLFINKNKFETKKVTLFVINYRRRLHIAYSACLPPFLHPLRYSSSYNRVVCLPELRCEYPINPFLLGNNRPAQFEDFLTKKINIFERGEQVGK